MKKTVIEINVNGASYTRLAGGSFEIRIGDVIDEESIPPAWRSYVRMVEDGGPRSAAASRRRSQASEPQQPVEE